MTPPTSKASLGPTVILGGAFDPPTLAHEKLIQESLINWAQDVWILPTPELHAYGKNTSTYYHRWAMCHLAFQHFGAKVKIFDTQLHNLTYAWNTVEKLKQLYPQQSFVWAIGTDHVDQLVHWHRGMELQKLIPFWVYPREGYTPTHTWHMQSHHRSIAMQSNTVSSTYIRDNVRNLELIRTHLHPDVFQYIQQQQLFVSQI